MRYFRSISRLALAALFVGSGSLHLLKPGTFLGIVPPYVPKPGLMVTVSGVAEILGGIGILLPLIRPTARWGLLVLLVAVFPANVYMAQEHIEPKGMHIPAVILWARLPLQPLLMWWLLACTHAEKEKGLRATCSPQL